LEILISQLISDDYK